MLTLINDWGNSLSVRGQCMRRALIVCQSVTRWCNWQLREAGVPNDTSGTTPQREKGTQRNGWEATGRRKENTKIKASQSEDSVKHWHPGTQTSRNPAKWIQIQRTRDESQSTEKIWLLKIHRTQHCVRVYKAKKAVKLLYCLNILSHFLSEKVRQDLSRFFNIGFWIYEHKTMNRTTIWNDLYIEGSQITFSTTQLHLLTWRNAQK